MSKAKTRSKLHHDDYDLHGDVAKIKAALSDAVHNAKEKASDAFAQRWEHAKERSSNLHEGVSNFTADKPLQTVGIAFLAGILLGFFIRK